MAKTNKSQLIIEELDHRMAVAKHWIERTADCEVNKAYKFQINVLQSIKQWIQFRDKHGWNQPKQNEIS